MSEDLSAAVEINGEERTPPLEAAPLVAESLLHPHAVLKPKKAKPFFGLHPWVLDSSIKSIDPTANNGDVVDVVTHDDKWIARGIVNRHSRIQVRLYTWSIAEQIDASFWRDKLKSAIQTRQTLGLDDPHGAVRYVFSEADGLSGLIVDRYADVLVVQPTALAMAHRAKELSEILATLVPCRSVILRADRYLQKNEGLTLDDAAMIGDAPDGHVFIQEHGIKYGVDLSLGHKTGFYLDQRDNRKAAAALAKGRRVLDLFCYTGGFSLNTATRGGAREVLGIDVSERAVETARANAALNGVANVRFQTQDCFLAADEMIAAGEKFDMVILDPPKFAADASAVDRAMRAYHRINRTAIDLLTPGGVLVTCSCTGRVKREDFLMMLSGVAQQAKRRIRIVEQRGAAADHPVSATSLEGEYLKCMICVVD
jgi:23S rRNA (cytosine1962-C5)-methyltransferase